MGAASKCPPQRSGKNGRPTIYCEKLAMEICKRIMEGQTLRKLVEADDMPTQRAIWLWLSKYPEFSLQYARAKEEQSDAIVEKMLFKAEEVETATYIDAEGNTRIDAGAVQAAKLYVDAAKWYAGKLKPKRWGDRIIHAGDAENPVTTKLVSSSDELVKKIKGGKK
jgi:hypothetical protein